MTTLFINLKDRFGGRFRTAHEGDYEGRNPWLQIIPCLHGRIDARGGDMLGAVAHRCGPIARRLVAMPFVRVVQDDDAGLNIAFDVAHFDTVAAILRPNEC